ncbi:MAG: hypothetical protein SF123_24035 [Chloroflexota bacterium]|nr:hypothetical protein [Chloroflexota bacterium]
MTLMIGSGTKVFLDTNIILRFDITDFAEHTDMLTVVGALVNAGSELWISHQVLREYSNVVTRPQAFMQYMSAKDCAVRVRALKQLFEVATDAALQHQLPVYPQHI